MANRIEFVDKLLLRHIIEIRVLNAAAVLDGAQRMSLYGFRFVGNPAGEASDQPKFRIERINSLLLKLLERSIMTLASTTARPFNANSRTGEEGR